MQSLTATADADRLPSAHLIRKRRRAAWAKIPGSACDHEMFVMKMPADPLKAATTAATSGLAILALAYLGIFAWACPQMEFVIAIIIEIAVLAVCVALRVTRTRSQAGIAQALVLDQLVSADKTLRTTYGAYRRSVLLFLCALCLCMSVDLCALASVSAEKFELSKSIYRAFPIWMCFGMHPAASAEVLAGADIQAGKHSRAEKILFLIKELRESIYGAKHEMIVAVYADLGDFYGKARQFSQSDFWYAKSIALSQQIKGPTGYGRPLTGLANSLREQGKLEPASRLYAQALSMRERIYGPGSTKVAETLEQFARLKLLQGDQQGAAQMLQRSQAIGNAHRTAQNANPTNIFIMLIFSWTAGYLLLGPKGLLTGLAVKILVNKIRTGEAPSPADLNRLETLQAYQARPVFLINLRKGF